MKRSSGIQPVYRTLASSRRSRPAFFESLEIRQLLSAAAQPATNFSTVEGFTPAQIAKAYGFDQITFSDGAVQGTGAGQTIAISDAFNDPTVAADLAVFDQQFGLSGPPSLKVVNQTGGTNLPANNGDWASETALDVEWAHAMAPQASILLVEASSDNDPDLVATVNYARHVPGVSVISMSWGGSERENYGGSETQSQLSYDPTFTTPSGHAGETFVASAGDSGSNGGVQWPASSPDVVAVGGTSLQTSDSSGTYEFEGPWTGRNDGTSGGFSAIETEPAYQEIAQQSGARSTPDVGYVADTNTGVAVYDSTPDGNGNVGWQAAGGTSVGAPQWAALIAVADQGRAILGKTTLDGASQTLPDLYSVYSPPGTAGYSTYTSYFHDIGNDGYGYTTGLGSPQSAAIASLLEGSSTTPTQTPTATVSPIAGVFMQDPPEAVVEGASGSLKVRLTNTGSAPYHGPVTVTLFASTDATVSSDDTQISVVTLSNVKLNGFASKSMTLKFTYPSGITAGSYNLIAQVGASSDSSTTPNVAVAGSMVTIEPPTVDLSTAFSGDPITVHPGRRANVSITITDDGNLTASGTLILNLFESAGQTLDVSDPLLATISGKKFNIRAGRSITLQMHFVAPPGDPAGSYNLIASTDSSTNPADANAMNDLVVVATA